MPLNGSGGVTQPVGSLYPAVPSTLIQSARANTSIADIYTILASAVYKDGQQTITQNIPLGGFKITGLGAAAALTDAAQVSQVQNSAYINLSSVAGTNTITGSPTPTPSAYAAGQIFVFIPAATNTAATTLNVNSLGAKNVFFVGAACCGGELVIGVPVAVHYDGTQFNILGPLIFPRLINTLGADVAINNAGNYFTGPTTAQGSVGTWYAEGSVTVLNTAGSGAVLVKLWDGTTVGRSGSSQTVAANAPTVVTLAATFVSPAGNIRMDVKTNDTTGVIKFNSSGNSKDSQLTVIRIA